MDERTGEMTGDPLRLSTTLPEAEARRRRKFHSNPPQVQPAAHRLLTTICVGPGTSPSDVSGSGETKGSTGAVFPTREGSIRKRGEFLIHISAP